jgi:hypothetical protein
LQKLDESNKGEITAAVVPIAKIINQDTTASKKNVSQATPGTDQTRSTLTVIEEPMPKGSSSHLSRIKEDSQDQLKQPVGKAKSVMIGTRCVYFTSKDVNPIECLINKPPGQVTLRDFKQRIFENSPWMTLNKAGDNLKHLFMFAYIDEEFGEIKMEKWNDDDMVPLHNNDVIYCWIESFNL